MDVNRALCFRTQNHDLLMNSSDGPLGVTGPPAQYLRVYIDPDNPGPRWYLVTQLNRLVQQLMDQMDAEIDWRAPAQINHCASVPPPPPPLYVPLENQ